MLRKKLLPILAATAAAVFIVTACGEYEGGEPTAIFTLGGGSTVFGFTPTPAAAPPPTPTVTPKPEPGPIGPVNTTPLPPGTPGDGDAGPGLTVFVNAGCTACHTIDSVPEAVGEIGPNLSAVASTAGSRVNGLTAEQYLRQSVMEPSEFLVEDYDNLMPAGLVPDQADFDNLIAYLLTLN